MFYPFFSLNFNLDMFTRKELSDFVEFCQVKYRINLNPAIIDDFMQTFTSTGETKVEIENLDEHHHLMGCSSNNIEYTHITFDSAKCNECPN